MKKGIILYKSKYGATKQYAQWLHEKTGFDIKDSTVAKNLSYQTYDIIIYCGGIYASGIAGLSYVRKHREAFKHKKLIILCVGASPYNEKALEACKQHNLKTDLKDVSMFYARGAWNEENMTWRDRTLCKLLYKAIAKKDPSTYEPWMEALMNASGQNMDWTDQKYLKPILDEIHHMNEK